MKLIRLTLGGAFLLCWIPVVWLVWAWDGLREAWMRQRLGSRYEGPAED